jgi:hypothetical protein
MAPITVSPKNANPTHHISLTDGKITIGLIAVDSQMKKDPDLIGRNPVERSSLKTSTGNQQYSDLEPPYTVLAQSNWAGGRGQDIFETDVTRFRDSLRLNTARTGKVMLAGREKYGYGYRNQTYMLPGSMKLRQLAGGERYLAKSISASGSYSVLAISLWIRYRGKPNADLTVKILSDSTGSPGSTLQTKTLAYTSIDALLSEFYNFVITSQAITSGTQYWVEVYGSASDDEDNHWEVGVKDGAGSTYKSSNGSTWTIDNVDLYYRLIDAPAPTDGNYFEYKKQLYFVSKPSDGTAAKLYMNGARGAAISNSGDLNYINAGGSPAWSSDEWVGCVAVIIGGTGLAEEQNWRVITGNTSASARVSSPWKIAHDTTTEFVILGSLKWTEITGHGLTVPVTDVLVSSMNVVYFAQGDSVNMRRMREYNSAGTWTRDFAADGTNKAVYLIEFNGGGFDLMQIVRSLSDCTIARAKPKAWATDLVFGSTAPSLLGAVTWQATHAMILYETCKPTVNNNLYYRCVYAGTSAGTEPVWPITPGKSILDGTVVWTCEQEILFTPAVNLAVGDASDRITNLVRYVDDNQDEAVWVMKEAGPWEFVIATNDTVDRVKLDEFKTIASSQNGKVACLQNVYLFYSVQNSMHRFYNPNLDDIGPTLDEGLPANRRGPISSMLSYPGRIYVTVDAGTSGYGSLLENNGSASYGEIYRAPLGERLYAMAFQVVPGDKPDKLWLRQGGDFVCLPFPSEGFDPYQDPNFEFVHEGALQMSGTYAGLQDAWKYWHSLKVHLDGLAVDINDNPLDWLEADYRLDGETDWHEMPDNFLTMPVSEVEFSDPDNANLGASAKRIDIRIRFYSINVANTPRLKALIIEAVTVSSPKFAYIVPALISVKNLRDEDDNAMPTWTRVRQLDEWSGTARPLKMRCTNPLFDDVMVFLQPVPVRPLASAQLTNEHDYVVTIAIQEA